MSDMYAIKTSTLTALGDAVRGKVIGISELPIITGTKTIGYKTVINIELPNYVKKTKVSGHIDWEDINTYPNRTVKIVSGIYQNGNNANGAEGSILIVAGKDYEEYDFELVLDGYQFTIFTSPYSSTGDSPTINYTAIGLDENGEDYKYTPLEMANAINGLEIPNIPPMVLTGAQSYGCSGALSSKYIELFGDKVSTNNINNANYMFFGYKNETIPFELNFNNSSNTNMSNAFNGCTNLKSIPKINNVKVLEISNIFANCMNLREIPDDIDATWDWSYLEGLTNTYSGSRNNTFSSCYSLRKFPMSFLNHSNPKISYSSSIYYSLFNSSASLDEVIGLPIPYHENTSSFTSNAFYNSFNRCSRLKDFTFETYEDGKPIGDSSHNAVKVPWKNQIIDLSTVGYTSQTIDKNYILDYNSGITADKEVKDDATYQALKNDNDWFATKVEYSRYNHDSAVRTINSLPDCNTTGTANNTIKFKGAAGSATDGGAINTLTSEEIAVATKKGWTVTFV